MRLLQAFVLSAATCVVCAAPLHAAWNPAGVDLTRPRLLLRGVDVAQVQDRITRPPYRGLLDDLIARAGAAGSVALDDDSIDAQRIKSRAAKDLAFLYAIDRTVVNDQVVPFDAPGRAAAAERVCDLLANLYPRSRLAVPAPLGGWDRDISSSEELMQWATAYDTLLGAGGDCGDRGPAIVERIADLASELYDNYLHPETASGFTNLHQNNHRAKSGAALVVAGITLADYVPPSDDTAGIREPSAWIEYGLDQVDLIMRYALVTGDGAYGEGPFYYRYASQNLLPFARAWDQLTGGVPWMADGVTIPSMWRHPLFAASTRWMLDMTLPDGTLAPVDDGNPERAFYFGALPPESPLAPAFAWRWAHSNPVYETDGNIDLAADAIVTYDDTVVPAAPDGPPTAFYVEGGDAIFRSDWSADAVAAVVLAEHDTASEFGRDRKGLGVEPESHEHAEPGAFLLHAYGERLALDPGYLSFSQRALVSKPEHHNLVLVDGSGPVDYLAASLQWAANKAGRPPADGQATLSDTLATDSIDAARVTARYGQPAERSALIVRRFLFPDHRYLVVADTITGPLDSTRTYTWLLHGNGGGTSGGDFELTAAGGRWTRAAARLDNGIAFDVGAPAVTTDTAIHEGDNGAQLTHTVLRSSATAPVVRSAQFVYPTSTQHDPPAIQSLAMSGVAALVLTDEASDRRALLVNRAASGAALDIPTSASGLGDVSTDADLTLVDTHLDGSLRTAWVENATQLTYAGTIYFQQTLPGTLSLTLSDGAADVVVANGAPTVTVAGLPFVPVAADGACSLVAHDGVVHVSLGRERRFRLRAAGANSIPAADPGDDRRIGVGRTLTLDGRRSCDADGDELTPSWRLVSAPAGSAWSLAGSDSWTPRLLADHPGPYRVRLVVTDSHGTRSREAEVLVIAGPACADGIDNDLDGRFDADDPGCRSGNDESGDVEPVCAGDCNGDHVTDVAELVSAVDIALARTPIRECPSLDHDHDGIISVDELVSAVGAALDGCPRAAARSGS